MRIVRMEGYQVPPRKEPWTLPGAVVARTLICTVVVLPDEGVRLRFGRNHPPEVEVSLGSDDRRVSRQHGELARRQGSWWLSNTGRSAIQLSDTQRIHPRDEPVPLPSGYTTLLITGSQNRTHVLELHVNCAGGEYPAPLFGAQTIAPATWPLDAEQRLVLAILGQQYIRRDPYPQPLTRQQAADQMAELRPGEHWDVKRVDRVVAGVRRNLSSKGVRGLTREEVGEPVGVSLTHNLLTELAVRTNTLTPADLDRLEDLLEQ